MYITILGLGFLNRHMDVELLDFLDGPLGGCPIFNSGPPSTKLQEAMQFLQPHGGLGESSKS
jgi:hypothetical protein